MLPVVSIFHMPYIWVKLGEGEVSQTARARTGVLDDGDMLLIFTALSLDYKQIVLLWFGLNLLFNLKTFTMLNKFFFPGILLLLNFI